MTLGAGEPGAKAAAPPGGARSATGSGAGRAPSNNQEQELGGRGELEVSGPHAGVTARCPPVGGFFGHGQEHWGDPGGPGRGWWPQSGGGGPGQGQGQRLLNAASSERGGGSPHADPLPAPCPTSLSRDCPHRPSSSRSVPPASLSGAGAKGTRTPRLGPPPWRRRLVAPWAGLLCPPPSPCHHLSPPCPKARSPNRGHGPRSRSPPRDPVPVATQPGGPGVPGLLGVPGVRGCRGRCRVPAAAVGAPVKVNPRPNPP